MDGSDCCVENNSGGARMQVGKDGEVSGAFVPLTLLGHLNDFSIKAESPIKLLQ